MPSRRLPSNASPSRLEGDPRSGNLILTTLLMSWCAFGDPRIARLPAQRPPKTAEILAINDFRSSFADIKNESHAPVASPEGADRGDVRRELIAVCRDVITLGKGLKRSAARAQCVNNPRNRSKTGGIRLAVVHQLLRRAEIHARQTGQHGRRCGVDVQDRKSTRLNSSHVEISYAVFCLKKKRNP